MGVVRVKLENATIVRQLWIERKAAQTFPILSEYIGVLCDSFRYIRVKFENE